MSSSLAVQSPAGLPEPPTPLARSGATGPAIGDPLLQPGAALVLALGVASTGARAAAARAEALVPELSEADWTLAGRWARAERAEGVLARALETESSVRGAIVSRWGRLGMVADFRQARLEGALGEALATLQEAGIPTMLLKGAALASAFYPRGFADRPMADVDLLLPAGAATEAYERLRQAGWTTHTAPGRAAFYAAHHHLPQLRHAANGTVLELHRAMLPPGHPFAWDEPAIWASARTVRVRGARTLVPNVEELLLHAAVHLAWANELRVGVWGWTRDLAVLTPHVNWERLLRLAIERRATSCLYWALRLGRRLGGVRVPTSVLAALRPAGSWGAGALERHLVLDAVPPVATPRAVALRRLAWRAAIRPVSSGHGAARPWTAAGTEAVRPRDVGEPSSGAAERGGALLAVVRRGAREVRRVGVWLRWAWRLLG